MHYFSRRQFSTTLLTSAMLPLFANAKSWAAGSQPIQNVLIMVTTGPRYRLWQPSSGAVFSQTMAPLQEVADQVMLIGGLPMNDTSANHGSPQSLTGRGFGQAENSLDQALAMEIGLDTPQEYMVLGTGGSGGDLSMFWRNKVQAARTEDPVKAFSSAFVNVPVGGGGATPPAGDKLDAVTQRRRKSILDLVRGDIATLKRELPRSEQGKLAFHLDSLRQLEKRIVSDPSDQPAKMCQPNPPASSPAEMARANALLLDVGVQAIACGMTRVVSVQFGTHQGGNVDYAAEGFVGDTHGEFIHGGDGTTSKHINYEKWCAKQFAQAVKTLSQLGAPGGGTMLDRTVLLWARDMGDGENHHSSKMPYVLAGGGSYFRYQSGSRFVDNPGGGAASHESLLRTVADALGAKQLKGFGSKPEAPLLTELK